MLLANRSWPHLRTAPNSAPSDDHCDEREVARRELGNLRDFAAIQCFISVLIIYVSERSHVEIFNPEHLSRELTTIVSPPTQRVLIW